MYPGAGSCDENPAFLDRVAALTLDESQFDALRALVEFRRAAARAPVSRVGAGGRSRR